MVCVEVLADLGAVGEVEVDVLGAEVDVLLVDVLGAGAVDVDGAGAVDVDGAGAVGVAASAATGILTSSAAPTAAPHRIFRTLLPLFVSQL